MIFEYLSETDKELINAYRKRYGNAEYSGCYTADFSKVFREWDRNKERLFHLFGDKFIISEDIEYEEGEDEVWNRIDSILYDPCKDGHRELMSTIQRAYPWVCIWDIDHEDKEALAEAKRKQLQHEAVSVLFNLNVLSKNKFEFGDEPYIDIDLPNGEKLRIQKGSKPMKAIKKLAEAHGVGHFFEAFRNDHSICLQTKKLKGRLSFSIHPLDYMTMSDNEHDWSSCMSWREEGEYRTGTLEMMNSPCVVVGYLSSDSKTMAIPSCDAPWNSKKWRCLFIVDKNFIFSIKQYPYFNAGLCTLATETLAKLIGWNITEGAQEYDYYKARKGSVEYTSHGKSFVIETDTRCMYNDCGSTTHFFIVNPEAEGDSIGRDADGYSHYYMYSGYPTCIACGEPLDGDYDFIHTCLTCSDVDEVNDDCCCDYCECGNRIYEDEGYWIGDDHVCYRCYENYGCYSELMGENYWREECVEVYLSKEKDKYVAGNSEVSDWCPEHCLERTNWSPNEVWSYSYWKGKNEGYDGRIRYDEDEKIYYVYEDDITDYGLSMIFGIHSRDEWLSLTTPSQPQTPAPEIELPF